jgi:hypothetical protein
LKIEAALDTSARTRLGDRESPYYVVHVMRGEEVAVMIEAAWPA